VCGGTTSTATLLAQQMTATLPAHVHVQMTACAAPNGGSQGLCHAVQALTEAALGTAHGAALGALQRGGNSL